MWAWKLACATVTDSSMSITTCSQWITYSALFQMFLFTAGHITNPNIWAQESIFEEWSESLQSQGDWRSNSGAHAVQLKCMTQTHTLNLSFPNWVAPNSVPSTSGAKAASSFSSNMGSSQVYERSTPSSHSPSSVFSSTLASVCISGKPASSFPWEGRKSGTRPSCDWLGWECGFSPAGGPEAPTGVSAGSPAGSEPESTLWTTLVAPHPATGVRWWSPPHISSSPPPPLARFFAPTLSVVSWDLDWPGRLEAEMTNNPRTSSLSTSTNRGAFGWRANRSERGRERVSA